MTYRDEGDAILERVRALTRELAVARREIDELKRKLRGDPEPAAGANETATEIIEELASARALLAGLIGDGEPPAPEPQRVTPPAVKLDPSLEVLRRALTTSLVHKFGAVDSRQRKAITEMANADDLIDAIAEVGVAKTRAEVAEVLTGSAGRG